MYLWASFVVAKLSNGLHWPVRVYTCQNATLFEITCRGINQFVVNCFPLGKENHEQKSVIKCSVFCEDQLFLKLQLLILTQQIE